VPAGGVRRVRGATGRGTRRVHLVREGGGGGEGGGACLEVVRVLYPLSRSPARQHEDPTRRWHGARRPASGAQRGSRGCAFAGRNLHEARVVARRRDLVRDDAQVDALALQQHVLRRDGASFRLKTHSPGGSREWVSGSCSRGRQRESKRERERDREIGTPKHRLGQIKENCIRPPSTPTPHHPGPPYLPLGPPI